MSETKKKILLVEDEAMIVEMYKLRFNEDGFEVLVTDKGSEAIKLAKEEKPNIILLDIILPEMDGFAILEQLKGSAATKKIPVIMLTNLGQESDQKKGTEGGADSYLLKASNTPAEVVKEIKKLIK